MEKHLRVFLRDTLAKLIYFLYFSKKNVDFLIQLGYSDNRKGITGNGCPCVGKK